MDGKTGTEEASSFLLRLQRNPEYIAFKSYVETGAFLIEDFEKLHEQLQEVEAGNKRFQWLDSKDMHPYRNDPSTFIKLADRLKGIYTTPETILGFITKLDGQLNELSEYHRRPPIIEVWAQHECIYAISPLTHSKILYNRGSKLKICGILHC